VILLVIEQDLQIMPINFLLPAATH